MRFYRLLLRLYPRSFRAEYGEEMSHVFAERRLRASGPLAILTLWQETVLDVFASALRVHGDLLRQDLGYAFRSHRRAPGLAVTAVVVTALGIGANTAVFSITDQVLIRPLPFADSGRLVKLWQNVPGYARMELSPPNYLDWKRMSSSFESMAAYYDDSVNLVGQGDPLRLEATVVEGDLFRLLAVPPMMGRVLVAEDGSLGAPAAVVLSYGLWQRVFGGSMDVLGQAVRLDDRVSIVVGVMPRSFHYPDPSTDLWTALSFRSDEGFEDRRNKLLQVVAKIRPGVSIDEARAEMEIVTEKLEEAYPEDNENTRATVISLRDEIPVQARLLLAALFGASVCVLLIACANLAHLLLSRGMDRQKELTVRTALGAGRDRLLRQLLTESVALSLLGGAVGLVLASVASPLLGKLAPPILPVARETTLDARVLAFAALVTILTGVGFGVLPALKSSGGLEMKALREGARAGVGGRRRRLRAGLVVAEVAVSIVLLISSGLLIRALVRVRAVDPGFRTCDVLAVHTALPGEKYEITPTRVALYTRVLKDVRAVPGVRSAAYTSFLPMVVQGGIWQVAIPGLLEAVEGGAGPAGKTVPETASLRYVTPDFFATLGIPLRLGRDVREADAIDAPLVAVVSESFARRFWPGEDPLGRRFGLAFAEWTVVGVVGDIRVRGLERKSEPQVYLPYRQQADRWLLFYAPRELVVRLERAETDRGAIVAAVRKVLHGADPELPMSEVRTLEDVVEAQTAPRLTQVRILGAFAGLSILLSAVGIYGLLSYAVSRRRAEIGLRIAFGARSSDILKMVLREGALLALAGALSGAVLGYAAGRAMQALLAGVEPGDAVTYSVAAVIVVVMTLSGSLFPALRASRVDPTRTLRSE
jgi:putative ABC transport system permease protein